VILFLKIFFLENTLFFLKNIIFDISTSKRYKNSQKNYFEVIFFLKHLCNEKKQDMIIED